MYSLFRIERYVQTFIALLKHHINKLGREFMFTFYSINRIVRFGFFHIYILHVSLFSFQKVINKRQVTSDTYYRRFEKIKKSLSYVAGSA